LRVQISSFFSATEDIPRADEIRTLIKDIWDLRMAKLRSSIDAFLKSDSTHAKVSRSASLKEDIFLSVYLFDQD
jgi:hypothetical protein